MYNKLSIAYRCFSSAAAGNKVAFLGLGNMDLPIGIIVLLLHILCLNWHATEEIIVAAAESTFCKGVASKEANSALESSC